ncbi:MAG: AMP-binding protein [Motiliproteus sp.]
MMLRRDDVATPVTGVLDFEGYGNLIDVLERAWQRYPEHIAFSNLGSDLSYCELDQKSRDFAAYLQCSTVLQPGDRFAIQLPNLLQYPIVLFGALRAGLVVVNISPQQNVDELQHQLCDSGAKGLLLQACAASQLETVIEQTKLNTVIVTEQGDALPNWKRFFVNASARYLKTGVPAYHQLPGAVDYCHVMQQGSRLAFSSLEISGADLALLQYSGGTTALSKAAMLTHHNLLANLIQVKLALNGVTEPGCETVIAPLPLYHLYSFTVSCMLMLEIGAKVVLISDSQDTNAFIHELKRHEFTIFSGSNTLFSDLCQQSAFSSLRFDRLKLTISGGMALNPAVAECWQQLTGCSILEGYGLAETAPIISVNPPAAARLGSIGLPVAGTEIRLVDDDGAEVPVGGSGELCVRGAQVMQGYWKQPQQTAQVFDDDGWLRTGDIASIGERGYLTLVDRKKDVINVSGFSVYPSELEQVISAHPDVDDCVVVGVPGFEQGEQVKLYLVSANPDLTVQQIRQHCRERLTAYKIPSQVEFRKELPRSAVGKVLRRALRDAEQQKRHPDRPQVALLNGVQSTPFYTE